MSAESALSISNTDIKLWKSGATAEANKNSGGATHIAAGRYYCVLDATDTDTIGPLEVNVAVSGALPVKQRCCVLHANVFDVLFGSTAPSTHTAAAVQALVAAGAVASVTGNVGGNVTGSVGSVAAGGITAASIATGAIDADALATDAVTEIQSGLSTLDAAGVRAAVGLTSADLDDQLAGLRGATFDTATDSLEAIRNRGDAAWATAAGFSTLDAAGVRSAVGLASADLDAQLAGLPTAAEAADAVAARFGIPGSVSDATPAAGGFDGDSGLSSDDGFYVGSLVAFTGGALDGIARKVTGYTGATRTFAFAAAFPAAPADEDTFLILGRIDD